MPAIAENLKILQKHIDQTLEQNHRPLRRVVLLAASKGQSSEKIREAFHAGQRIFGENYLQEALKKMDALSDLPIEWHFIGSIQRNKTQKIAAHFSWVESVADPLIAKRLNEQRPLDLPPLNICIEVNISKEPAKSGVLPHEVLTLAQYCLTLPRLKLRGLMCIPAKEKTREAERLAFQALFSLGESLKKAHIPIDTLSMGMSDDWEAAVLEGSTLIRIGSALFGPRS